MAAKDHFSGHAADYARWRPTYPPALFDFLAAIAPSRHLAWDCATGNGQAAVALAERFDRVVATDLSAPQVAAAIPRANVEYRVAPAEESGLAPASVDLTTVAQALHWLDFARFHAEFRRVSSPGAVFAAWCYDLLHVDPAVDAVLDRFYGEIVGPYWPPERRLLEEGYRTIPFPLTPVEAPSFEMRALWTLSDLVGYLGTWSATQYYRKALGADPVDVIRDPLARAWGDLERRRDIAWPLALVVGRL